MALLFRAKEPSPLALDKNMLYLTNLGIPWASGVFAFSREPLIPIPYFLILFLQNISAAAR